MPRGGLRRVGTALTGSQMLHSAARGAWYDRMVKGRADFGGYCHQSRAG